MKRIVRYFVLSFLFSVVVFPQKETERWIKKEINYETKVTIKEREYNFHFDSFSEAAFKLAAYTYWFSFSEHDGDNCPFYPSCSSFIVEAVKETNPVEGVLLFFDRFTRDANIFERDKNYAKTTSGKYYDPPSSYSFSKDKIIYFPSSSVIVTE